jgi:hypothetical protein
VWAAAPRGGPARRPPPGLRMPGCCFAATAPLAVYAAGLLLCQSAAPLLPLPTGHQLQQDDGRRIRRPAWAGRLRTSWDEGRQPLPVLPNVTAIKIYNATRATGVYSHAPMLSYHRGLLLASWKNHNTTEDSPGQFVRWAWSSDGGASYSEPATLFPNVSDGSQGTLSVPNCSHTPAKERTAGCAHLFAEPTLVLGAAQHVYMAASLQQFCLYPYPWPGRRDVLLRRVSITSGQPPQLGPIFWLDGIPPSFEAVSARLGLVSLESMDAITRTDVAELSNPRQLPCVAGAKCEACVGSCQPLPPIMGAPAGKNQQKGCDIDYEGTRQSWIERTRYTVPGSQREILLYRNNHSKETAYFCFSTRAGPHEPWSEPAPSGIPDSTSNMNAGMLPDGRIFVLSNHATRATLVLSLSHDGYNFSHAYDIAACDRAPFSNPSQPNGCKRRNIHPGVGFGVCYPQGVVVPELGALFVIASVNPEDIWVLNIPLASI